VYDVTIDGVTFKGWGGDDAVEVYKEDPDASVSERIKITADSVGRVA
jgi:hypothetical protein